jgi:hypothetical protein
MNQKTVLVQEQIIAIAAKNHSATILTPEFLKCSGTVPSDWELARQPVCTPQGSQVTFANGINVVAEPQRIMFAEALDNKTAAEMLSPAIACKYVQALPQMECQAVGINFRGFAVFDSQKDAAREYISEKLFSSGEWQQIGIEPMRATINLSYTLEGCVFNLNLNEAVLRQPDGTTSPIIIFGGNFSYDIVGKNEAEKLAAVERAINRWQSDLETYRDIINTKFLASVSDPKVVVPDVFAMSTAASV